MMKSINKISVLPQKQDDLRKKPENLNLKVSYVVKIYLKWWVNNVLKILLINAIKATFSTVSDELKSLVKELVQDELKLQQTTVIYYKLKSFKGVKNELRAFFSIRGLSSILDSKSLFRKFFLLIFVKLILWIEFLKFK